MTVSPYQVAAPQSWFSCVGLQNGQVKLLNFRARLLDLRPSAEAIPLHRPWATQRFDACLSESGVAHPAAAIRASEVETGLCVDQHVQAREQVKRVLWPLVINDRFVHDQGATSIIE